MSTTTIVCGSAELHSLLTAVRTAAGAEETLPMIAGVLLHTARDERRGDVLVATATDRYRALQGSASTSGQIPARVWLTRQQVTQVLAITRPYTTRRRAAESQVEITVTDDTVTVRQLALDGLADIAVTFPADAEHDFPDVGKIITDNLAKPRSDQPFAVVGKYLADMGRLVRLGEPMQVHSTGADKPLVVHIGDRLVALLMPVRLSDERAAQVAPVFSLPTVKPEAPTTVAA